MPNTTYRVKLMALVEEGVVDKDSIVQDLLNFLSESEAKDFSEQYGYSQDEEEDSDDDEEE